MMARESIGAFAASNTSSGDIRQTAIHQQTADGARGAGAARKTNCQTRKQPGGAPVDSLRITIGADMRRQSAASIDSIQSTDATGTETVSSFRR